MTDPSFQLRVPSSGPVVTGTPGYVLTFGADGRTVHGAPPGGGGAVSSVFGRTGAVVAVAGDYAASQVVNDSSVAGFSVKDALNTLLTAGGGVVSSVFGRVGAVVAAAGDYTTSQVTNASTVTGATTTDALNTVQTHLTSLDGSVVSLGSLITGLQASNIHNNSAGPGTTVADTLTAYNTHLTSLDGSVVSLGSLITNLKASNIGNDSSVVGSTVKDALNTAGQLGSIVFDNTARDAVPAGIRAIGSIAYVASTDLTYRLIGGTANANWADITVYPLSATHAGIAPIVSGANLVLASDGTSAPGWATITNAVVDAAAAIAGTKVSPNFGAQAIVTTGSLSVGAATVAASGNIRLGAGGTLKGYDNSAGTTTFSLMTWGVSTTNALHVGDTTNAETVIDGGTNVGIATANVRRVQVGSAVVQLTPAELSWSPAVATAPLFRVQNVSGTLVFDATMRGQGSTNVADVNGGGWKIQGGKKQNAGLMGRVALQLNLDDATFYSMCDVANVVGSNRVLSLARGADLTAAMMPANTGDLVIAIGNAATNPTAAPVGGLILAASGGNLLIYTPNASKTTVGAAGGAAALPATPTAYIPIKYNNVDLCMPAFLP